MNDSSRATEVLKHAREILLDKLAERILEAEAEILDEAQGLSYSSELESIYEQLGIRLGHVNQLLSYLPSAEHASATGWSDVATHSLGEPRRHDDVFQTDTVASSSSPALLTETASESPPAPSLQVFVRQIHAGDVAAAGRTLAPLLELAEHRAGACASLFHEQYRSSPDAAHKAQRLKLEIESGSVNAALVLLWECFGLQGNEAIGAWHSLRAFVVRREL